MGGIAVLLSSVEFSQVQDSTFKDHPYVFICKKIKEEQVAVEAEEVAQQGGSVIVSSKSQAEAIRQAVSIPVVELGCTCQDVEESIWAAIEKAEIIHKAVESDRRNKAQMNSLLDSMFHGLMEINSAGEIVMMNRVMEGILNKGQNDVIGRPVKSVIKDLNKNLIDQVLHSPQESFSSFLNVNGKAMVMILSPIVLDDKISGAYLSLKKINKNDEIQDGVHRVDQRGGFVTSRTFSDICYTSEIMAKLIEQAKLYAQSHTPLMVEGQSGDDRENLCQGIHNYSLRKSGPYVIISMVGLSEDRQMEALFGSGGERRNSQRVVGALEKANGGTLVITGIGFSSMATQSALCRFIRENSGVLMGNGEIKLLDVRIIVTSTESLLQMRKKNIVTFTFFYIFSGLVLRIPPLEERREDIVNYVNIYLKRYTQQYSRYQVLTDEAMEYLKSYHWFGSGLQIERFVERMVLTIEKRTIKRHMVEALLQEMYPDEIFDEEKSYKTSSAKDAYETLLRATLLKHSGNRNETARELGISPTTLWRKMKKYGISD